MNTPYPLPCRMKSLLKFAQKEKPGLVGKAIKVGPYNVRVEAVLGQGGFASIYRVRDSASSAAYALKHMRLMRDPEAIADCQTEIETLKRLRSQPHVLTLRATAFAGVKGQEEEAFLLLDLCSDSLVDFMHRCHNRLTDTQVGAMQLLLDTAMLAVPRRMELSKHLK